MKYIPLNAKDRSFISTEYGWNWYFLRNVFRTIHVMKGPVMPGSEYFHRAFGDTSDKFIEILHMPEKILMHRGRTPGQLEKDWELKFQKLNKSDRSLLIEILCGHRTKRDLMHAILKVKNSKVSEILEYYMPETQEVNESNTELLFNGLELEED
jgi:hypothetical protein